jgi:hypothetical protein
MPWRYLARYRLSDEPAAVLARVYEANASGAMEIPEWITDVGAWIFETAGSPEVPSAADWGERDEATLFVFSNGSAHAELQRELAASLGQHTVAPPWSFHDAGSPFDPDYPSPWQQLSTFALNDGAALSASAVSATQLRGVTDLAAAAYSPLTPAHTK